MLSLALSALGAWPLALLRGAWSALLEAVRTPVGAAVVAALIAWPIADHRGAARVEARHTAATERARIAAEARTEVDREAAIGWSRTLAARAEARAVILEEITHAPLPSPRPGGNCTLDPRRLRLVR